MIDSPGNQVPLAYESAVDEASGRYRPKWVWAILVVYLLLALCFILLPLWAAMFDWDSDSIQAAGIVASAFTLSGLCLIFTPVRTSHRRPITRRSIWIPLLGSGFLLGLLMFAGMMAMWELTNGNFPDERGVGALVGAGVVWLGWTLVLWILTMRRDPTSVAVRIHRWLFAGSLAELLVAVPCHLVVRRRHECCAGIATGTAICVGAAVMFLSLGPAVLFLYYRRWQKVAAKRQGQAT